MKLTFQPKPLFDVIADAPQDDLLDSFSLQIVLDMLAVMTTIDELTQLESLTPEQKKQVWGVTPEEVKLRLKKIRAGVPVELPNLANSAKQYADSVEQARSVEDIDLEGEGDREEDLEEEQDEEIEPEEIEPEEIEEIGDDRFEIPTGGRLLEGESSEDEKLEEMGEAIDYNALSESSVFDLSLFQSHYDLGNASIPANLEVGDRVVLRAEPSLSAAELMAVWEVVKIQGEQARIEAKGLGSRQYPLVWMVTYPDEEPEF